MPRKEKPELGENIPLFRKGDRVLHDDPRDAVEAGTAARDSTRNKTLVLLDGMKNAIYLENKYLKPEKPN